MDAPILIKPIPPQQVEEGRAFGPFFLTEHIGVSDKSSPVHYSATLTNGQPLPQMLVCTSEGVIVGILETNTRGDYEIIVTAKNEAGAAQTTFNMAVAPGLASEEEETQAPAAAPPESAQPPPAKATQPPILVKTIPSQVVNEQAGYGPFDLKEFIQVAEGTVKPQFTAELKDGKALPTGLICTSDGILTGIPAKDTNGNYEVVVKARNEAGQVEAGFVLRIKPSLAREAAYLDQLKAQVWKALEQHLPIPNMQELYSQPITVFDVHYILERWGILKVWNAFDLSAPDEKKLLKLEGASKHYNIFDFGNSLVVCPKDLFSYERTLEDGLQTSRALAREVYKRGWTIEVAGYDKFLKAAWVELQHLGDQHGKRIEIINFSPTTNDLNIYSTQAREIRMRKSE